MTTIPSNVKGPMEMRPLPTSLAVAFRRMVAVVMCILTVMSATASIDAPAHLASPATVQAEVEMPRGLGGDDRQDGSPCHATHHLCGKVMPLPPALAGGTPATAHPERPPAGGPSRVLVSSVADRPTEPPRT